MGAMHPSSVEGGGGGGGKIRLNPRYAAHLSADRGLFYFVQNRKNQWDTSANPWISLNDIFVSHRM